MKLVLRLSYLGTNYKGYQVQGDIPTVQKALNEAAFDVLGYECDITGCSRTDSGVHANDFCIAITKKGSEYADLSVPLGKIPLAFNAHLPEDISVREACLKNDSFHPRYDVVMKEYVYLVHNSRIRDPFSVGRAMSFPYSLSKEDIERMNKAAQTLCGERDFAAYMASGSKVTSTVRDMKYAHVECDGEFIKITLAANGFLYNMVRIIAGTLLDVGRGKRTVEEFVAITESKERKNAGATAPACGLYLNKVVY